MATAVVGAGVSGELPAGWEDRTMVTLVGPRGARGFAPNIVVTREPLGEATGLPQYARRQLELTRAELPGLEVIDERLGTHREGVSFQRVQRFPGGELMVQQVQVMILAAASQVVHVITLSADAEELAAQLPGFQRFVDSFRVQRHGQ